MFQNNPIFIFAVICLVYISRVPEQNGASLLYAMLEIHHSGREPSIYLNCVQVIFKQQSTQKLLTLNVLYHTMPHKLCEEKDVRDVQSFVSTHFEESDSVLALFAIKNTFNVCIFETEFSHFFRGVGLGVYTVHHCHQELKS